MTDNTMIIIESVCAVFLALMFIVQVTDRSRLKSSRLLKLCTLVMLLSLVIDSMAYYYTGPETPFCFRYTICILAYSAGGINALCFAYYSEAYCAEKAAVDPRLFRILKVACVLWIFITAEAFVAGRLVVYENGLEVADNGFPLYISLYQMAVMLYTPVVALVYRKEIGREAVFLLTLFNLTPLVGILSAIFIRYDGNYIFGTVALIPISELLQRKRSQEQQAELAMHDALAENNSRIFALEEEQRRNTELQLQHEQLRSEVLSYMVDNDDDPIELLKNFAERIRILINCDQVIYRDLEETRIMVNSPSIEDTWHVPIEYCMQCEHFDAHHPMYSGGYTEMDNCQAGWQGIPVYHDCPIKSSLTRIVYCDGEVAGYLAIHYVVNYHHFTDVERSTLEEFTRILSISLSRYKARNENRELKIISEMQKQLQEALALAETASRAKTEFLFSMSHDIRTPMNAILGYTDIALRHIDEQEKVNDSLKKIRTSGGHLLSLINDILEMSRIEAGRLEIVNTPVDAYEVTETVANMSKALAAPRDITFRTVIGELNNPYIYSDELHTNQILINLISNAIKYTEPGGTVEYRLEQVSEPVDGTARYRMTVSDNGIGMSEEFQKHLFESFSRENTTTVSKQEGAGLGLAIVKRILDHIGGTISVTSRKGVGSTFVVELPLQVMDDEAIERFRNERGSSRDAYADVSLKGRRLLLVEDNEMNREIAAEILEENGLIIETAEDGAAAVRMVAEKGTGYYDAILMDIQMPVMDGYEATAEIQKLPGGDTVPIIALSANAFTEDVAKSLAAGMSAHVAKPIDIAKLKETLVKFL